MFGEQIQIKFVLGIYSLHLRPAKQRSKIPAKSEFQALPTMIPVTDQFKHLGIKSFSFTLHNTLLSRISKGNYQSLLNKIKSNHLLDELLR